MTEQLLTPTQVASILSLEPRTVHRWLRAGKLQGIKLGRCWRVRAGDLEILVSDSSSAKSSRSRQDRAKARLQALGV